MWPQSTFLLWRLWCIFWSQTDHSNFACDFSSILFAWGGEGWHVVLCVCYTKLSSFEKQDSLRRYVFLSSVLLPKWVFVSDSQHKTKTIFIDGMGLVSLHYNRDFISVSSNGLGWYKYAITTQWYQFHTSDAWWSSQLWCVVSRLTIFRSISWMEISEFIYIYIHIYINYL